MKALTLAALAILVHVSPARAADAPPRETVGRVERLDAALDALVPPDAKIEKLETGFDWSEGPVWVTDGGFVLFSDVAQNTVFRWSEKDGIQPYLKPSGFTGRPGEYKGKEPGSNGLAVGPDGALYLCQHGDRRIARLKLPHDPANDKPAFETVVDRSGGKRFNSPNDLCFDAAGNVYFTDPPYGLSTQDDKAAEKELDVNGVYRFGTDGKLTLLTKELVRPNGVALSPDDKTLYVAQSDGSRPVIMAFDVTPDGVANGRVFFDTTPLKGKGPGGCDGLKVDAAGNVFATGPGGVMVLSKDGKHLGTIRPSDKEPTANCAFGGRDGTWLYMTNDSSLCRIKLATKGRGFKE